MKATEQLHTPGQSLRLDDITRELLTSGREAGRTNLFIKPVSGDLRWLPDQSATAKPGRES